jgi:hypothetical protein
LWWCDVEKECRRKSDELSLRFALLNILMIRIKGCDLQVSGIPFNNNNVFRDWIQCFENI